MKIDEKKEINFLLIYEVKYINVEKLWELLLVS